MALVNEHFLKLPGNYLFADIAKKVNAYKVAIEEKYQFGAYGDAMLIVD